MDVLHLGHRAVTAPLAALLAAALVVGLMPPRALADTPRELDWLCVENDDKVLQATSPSDCSRRQVAVDVPATRPVHLCGRDDFGLVRWTTDPGACTRDHEFPITIPDSGPVILCSKNIKNGRLQPTGELRFADDVARCDSQFYTPFITPAAPEAVADTYMVDEDTLLTVAARGVLDNDADASGGPLTAHLVADINVGSVDLESDGGFTWDPRGLFDDLDAGQSRDVRFTYLTSDGELESDPTSVTITVTGRNDVPVATADTFTTDEDTALQVVQPGVLTNDTDAEAGLLSAHLVEDVAAGTLRLDADGGLHYDPSDAFEHLGTDERADVSFTYVARDGHDDSTPATVGIAVTGVNDRPVGTADAFTTDENTPIELTPGQLLANDTDAEGTPLTVVDVVTGTPADAFAVADGTVTLDPRAAFDDLEDGQSRTATFSYAASDGDLTSARTTVTITVTGISPPRPLDDRAGTDEDTPVEIPILANDGVAGADVVVDAAGSLGSAVSYTDGVATFDPRGQHDDLPPGGLRRETFAYTLTNDEGTATAAVEVLIEGREDAPVAHNDHYGPIDADRTTEFLGNNSVLFNDTDADTTGTALRAVLVSPPELGRLTLNPNTGEFAFDPAGELTAGEKVTFRYRASDGTLESPTATVTLDTTADSVPVLEDQLFTYFLPVEPEPLPTFQVEARDNGPLRYSLPLGSADFTIDSNTGVISFLDEVPEVGSHTLEVQVVDTAGQSATATVTIVVARRVAPTDDLFDGVGNTPLVLGQPFDGIAVSLAGSVLDNDGAPGDVSTSSQTLDTTLGGHVDLQADGTFTYTPPRPRPAGVADPCDGGASTWDGTTPANDAFSYPVFDADGNHVGSPTVTVALTAVVWYVDPTGPAGCGTSTDPYVDLAPLSAPDGGPDSPGDVIHVLAGTTSSGITLEADQRLSGAGADLIAGGRRLLAATPAEPTTIGGPVRLAHDNAVLGFAIDSPAEGLVAASTPEGELTPVGAASVELPAVTAKGGPALRLGPGAPWVRIETVTHEGHSDALELRGTGGSITIPSVSGQGPATLVGAPNGATVDIGSLALSVSRSDAASADGLGVTDHGGMVTVGRLAVDLTGTALAVDNLAATGAVTVGRIEATHAGAAAPATGMTMTDNGGQVAIGHATLDIALRGDADRGLAVVNNTGAVAITGGAISATPPGPGVKALLMEARGGSGELLNEASVRLGTPTDPASGSDARALAVSGLGAGARVEQRGTVVDRGAGTSITGTAVDSLVLLSGASDVAVVDGVGLSVTNTGPVAITGPSHRFSSTRGPAVILRSAKVGDAGMTIGQATSVDSPHVQLSADPVVEDPDFPGVGIEVAAVTADGPGLLRVLAGQVDRPAVAGVRVQSSPGAVIGAVRVTDPGEIAGVPSSGVGLDVVGSPGAILQGASVLAAPSIGVQVAGSPNVVLDGVNVESSAGVGISLPNPDGTTVLRSTNVRDSRLVGLHVLHDDASAARTVVLDNATVSGSPPERHSIHVDASTAQPLSFTMGGATGSASFGGDHSLLVDARGGAQVNLALTRAQFGASGDDAVRVVADGTGSTVQVSATDMTATTAGGVLNAGGAGIALVGRDGGVIAGSMQRVDVTQSTTFGVLLDNVADGFVLDQVGVFGPEQVGIGVHSSDGVRIDRAEVQGAPAGHGIEVFLAHGLNIRRTRVDLSALPDPNPEDDSATYLPADVNDTCTAHPSRLTGPFQLEQLQVDGVAGIYARHVTGDVDLRDTTVLGATLHQVVVHNGGTLPGVVDPAGRPTPTAAERARALHLRVQDLQVLESDPARAALFVGSDGTTSPGTITTELLPGTIDTDAPPLFCALAGARLRVVTEQRTVQRDGQDVIEPSGTLTFPLRTARPALVMKTSDQDLLSGQDDDSRIDYDLRKVEFLWDAGLPPGGSTPAVEEDTSEGGTIVGAVSDVEIVDAPGDAFVAGSDTTIRGLRIVSPGGDGLIITDAGNVTATNVTVEEPGRHGVLVERSENVTLISVAVVRPGGAGIWAVDSDLVSITDLAVTDPAGPGVHLASVSSAGVTDATLTSSIPGPDGPRSGVHALNAVPLSLSRVSVSGFDATPIDIVVGTSHPDATELPSCPGTCAGTVELRGLTVSQTHDDDLVPGKDPAVRIRTGPGSSVTTDLGDSASQGTVLDAPLTVASSGTAASVTAEDATFEIAGPDGLRFSADDPGTLTADLRGVTLTRGPQDPGQGVGLLVTGVTATLTDTTITGPYQRGLHGTGSHVAVTGGTIAGATGAGVLADGGGALELVGASVSGDAVAVAASDLDRVHVGARAVDGAPGVRTMIANGLHVEGVGDVEIREADISRADDASGVTVVGGGPGQCTTLAGNTINAATAPAFGLADMNLKGYDPAVQSVEDYLTAHGNTPATVEALNVGSC